MPNIDPDPPHPLAFGDVVTFDEGVMVVQGLITWLKGCPIDPPVPIGTRNQDGTFSIMLPNAHRAGRVLEVLMHTSGIA